MNTLAVKNPNFDINDLFRYYALLLDGSGLPCDNGSDVMNLTVFDGDIALVRSSFIQHADKVGHYYALVNSSSPTFIMGRKYLFLTQWGNYATNEVLQCRNTKKLDFIYNKETIK
jgi:hypothetical protein